MAIKVLAPEMAATSPARKRFLREARSAAQVRHENVVQVHAIEEQPLPYLVMKYVPGETLQQRLDRVGPLDPAEVAVIGRQVADALAAAHAVGLIHRDVKPGNILLEAGPRLKAKVTDFGLARAADDASITQSGAVVGTPLYMSPEQALGQRLDPRTDLFSLGSVLYAITSGRPPFRAGSTLAVLKRVAEDQPRPIPEIIPEAPDWLCRVIARLMAKGPDDRFPSAAEVSAALEAGPQAAVTSRPAAPRRRSLAWLAVAAVLAVGVVTLGLWTAGLFDRPTRPTPPADATPPKGKTGPAEGRPPLAPLTRPSAGGFEFGEAVHVRPPSALAAGRLLAMPATERVMLFETPSGRQLRTVPEAGERIREVAISSSGRLLAAVSGGADNAQLRVWDLDNYQPLYTHTLAPDPNANHGRPAFSPDGTLLACAQGRDGNGGLHVWTARTGELAKTLPGTTGLAGFTADGSSLVVCEYGGARKPDAPSVYDTRTWKKIHTLPAPSGEGCDMHFSPDRELLGVGTSERFQLWNARTFERVGGFDATCYWAFAFGPKGKVFVAPSTDDMRPIHTFKWWDVRTGEVRLRIDVRFPGKAFAQTMSASADGRVLYLADEPGQRVRVLDAATGAELLPTPAGNGEK